MSQLYCPTCATMLLVKQDAGELRYACQTCTYIYTLDCQISKSSVQPKKEVDDVISLEEQMKNAPQTTVMCGKCNHMKAYFFEIQIRSADEPATTFYKCANEVCGNQWREQ